MRRNNHQLAWAGFWLFLAVYVVAEAWVYSKGHEAFFFRHKTPEELRIREAKVRLIEQEAGIDVSQSCPKAAEPDTENQ